MWQPFVSPLLLEEEVERRSSFDKDGEGMSFLKELGESKSGKISRAITPPQISVFARVKLALIAAPDKQEKDLLVWILVNELSSLSEEASESHWYPKLTVRSLLLFSSFPEFPISQQLKSKLSFYWLQKFVILYHYQGPVLYLKAKANQTWNKKEEGLLHGHHSTRLNPMLTLLLLLAAKSMYLSKQCFYRHHRLYFIQKWHEIRRRGGAVLQTKK